MHQPENSASHAPLIAAQRPSVSPPTSSDSLVRKSPPSLPADRPTHPAEFNDLWDIDDVANYLGVPKQTIYSWRQTDYGPQGFRVGKHLRWHAATVITWTLGLEKADRDE